MRRCVNGVTARTRKVHAENRLAIHRTKYGKQVVTAAFETDNIRIISGESSYIWQTGDWPNLHVDLDARVPLLTDVSRAQGLLVGRLADVGMTLRDQASLAILTQDVIQPSLCATVAETADPERSVSKAMESLDADP